MYHTTAILLIYYKLLFSYHRIWRVYPYFDIMCILKNYLSLRNNAVLFSCKNVSIYLFDQCKKLFLKCFCVCHVRLNRSFLSINDTDQYMVHCMLHSVKISSVIPKRFINNIWKMLRFSLPFHAVRGPNGESIFCCF